MRLDGRPSSKKVAEVVATASISKPSSTLSPNGERAG